MKLCRLGVGNEFQDEWKCPAEAGLACAHDRGSGVRPRPAQDDAPAPHPQRSAAMPVRRVMPSDPVTRARRVTRRPALARRLTQRRRVIPRHTSHTATSTHTATTHTTTGHTTTTGRTTTSHTTTTSHRTTTGHGATTTRTDDYDSYCDHEPHGAGPYGFPEGRRVGEYSSERADPLRQPERNAN